MENSDSLWRTPEKGKSRKEKSHKVCLILSFLATANLEIRAQAPVKLMSEKAAAY